MTNLKQEAASIHQSCQVTMAAVGKGEGRGVVVPGDLLPKRRRTSKDASHTAELQGRSAPLHG